MPHVKRSALRLTDEELDSFLRSNKWGRLATANLECEPHITPLGYVYHEGAIWFHAMRDGRRARDLVANPQAAFLVDDGLGPEDEYGRRRGAILYGRCLVADDHPALDDVRLAYMRAMGASGVDEVQRPRTHAWYRLEIARTSSWDFRKIPRGVDRKAGRPAR